MAVAAPAPAGSKSPKKVKEWKSPDEGQGRLAAIMLSPTFLVLLLVIGLPILAGIRQSFYTSGGLDANGFAIEGDQFNGIKNYTAIFSGESATRFWNAFYVTTFFTVVCVIIEVIIGVAMALIMNRAFKGRSLIRASILVPWAIPTVVSAVLWKWIFNANGVANVILGKQVLWSPGRPRRSSACWSSPASRSSRKRSTRPPRSTAPRRGTPSCTSPCPW